MAESQGQDAHVEVVDALTELYTLLDTLGALPAVNLDSNGDFNVCMPPHPSGSLNAQVAAAAGYAAEAVSLMSALPFLADEHVYQHGSGYQLMPSTYCLSYLGEDMSKGNFEGRREMLDDHLMPSTALKLTKSVVYGVEWIYDVGTRLITPWKPFDDALSDTNDYSHVTALPPRQVIGPLIDHYRRLDYLTSPAGEVDFSSSLFSEAPLDPVTGEAQPPPDWEGRDAIKWRAQYAVWRVTRGIKDIYLECGWDVESRPQPAFRRDEFLRRRAEYWTDVVEPLAQVEADL